MVAFLLVLILFALVIPPAFGEPVARVAMVVLFVVGLLCLLQVVGGVTLLPVLR